MEKMKMSKICTQCNGLGYTEEKSISDIFFTKCWLCLKLLEKFARFVTMELKPEDRNLRDSLKKEYKVRANGLDEGRTAKIRQQYREASCNGSAYWKVKS